MSKKSNNSSGAIFYIFFIIFAFSVYFVPLIILVALLISSNYYNKSKDRINGNFSDFWLNKEEKERFKKISLEMSKASSAIINSNQTADKNNLSRNKDGSINGRSKLGKELKQIISSNELILDELKPQYSDLEKLPEMQWRKFAWSFVIKESCLVSFVVYLVSSLLVISFFENGFERFISAYKSWFEYVHEVDVSLNMLVLVVALVACIISAFVKMKRFEIISPKPPTVSDTNVDEY